MAGNTPVYGFPYPEPTDLVADYPALGQQLAEDIETVLPTLGGLSPITPTSIANSGGTATLTGTTVTFTTVTSVSLNGVWTSSHANYRIVIHAASPSSNNYVAFRLRATGTDNTTSNYRYGIGQVNWAGTISTQTSGTGQTFARLSLISGANTDTGITMDVVNPQVANETILTGTNTNEGQVAFCGAFFNATTQFDGFTIYSEAASTLTGSVNVYGYK